MDQECVNVRVRGMWMPVGDESGWMNAWVCERLGVTMQACGGEK